MEIMPPILSTRDLAIGRFHISLSSIYITTQNIVIKNIFPLVMRQSYLVLVDKDAADNNSLIDLLPDVLCLCQLNPDHRHALDGSFHIF